MIHGIGAKLVSNWKQNMFLEQYIPTVSKFYLEKGYHVNRLQSVISGMQMSILQTRI